MSTNGFTGLPTAELESRGAAWRLLLAARATQDGTAVAEGSGDGTQHWMGAGISLAF